MKFSAPTADQIREIEALLTSANDLADRVINDENMAAAGALAVIIRKLTFLLLENAE